MTSRRTLIASGAGAAVLAALGYRAFDRGVFASGEGPAFEAWKDWQGHAGEDPARKPLHAAILAASAHNTQPWLFETHEDSITVYADLSRNLGAADPFRRELYVSLGCALQNLMLVHATGIGEVAAARLGAHPDNAPAKVVDMMLRPERRDAAPPELLTRMINAIPMRHTNRGPFRPDSRIEPPALADIFYESESGMNTVLITEARKDLGAMVVEATERFVADGAMSEDSGRWFRTGRREVEAHRDGIDTDGAGLSRFMGVMAKLLPDQDAASADKYWLASTRDVQVPTAAAYGIIFVRDRLTVRGALSTGSAWQRAHLLLTSTGLAAQPMNAPIEMMDRDHFLGRSSAYAKELRKIARVPRGMDLDPAFIFRLGYAERPAIASPRRKLDDVIIRKA